MSETVLSLFLDRVERDSDRVAMRVVETESGGENREMTWGEWGEASLRVALAISSRGHQRGSAVAILAGNSLKWPIADVGIQLAGHVSVGIHPTSAPAQVEHVLRDCGAVAVITDDRELLAPLAALASGLPRLREVISLDPTAAPGVTSWAAWLNTGAEALARDPALGATLVARARDADPCETAMLIYTSGSTGEPKGAALSHQYLFASTASIEQTLELSSQDTGLSFLPYSHAGERVFGLWTRIRCGMEAAVIGSHERVWETARMYQPTVFGGLPRFYEKAYEALRAEQEQARGPERDRWDRTIALGLERSRIRRAGDRVPLALEEEWRAVGEPALARARHLFGGRVRLATSGGASLAPEVGEYLDALGITVLGAYGLTEHLCVSFNRLGDYRFDDVGLPMPGTELRLEADGEILVRRSPMTFSGYHNRPDDSREAFTDDGEWLRTGDLGSLDERGRLRVIGRKKEIIALSTGKKVAPLPIERRLVEHPWIGQAVVYGDGRKFVTALLALRRSVVEAWAKGEGITATDGDLVRLPSVTARIREAVDAVNADLSRSESVREFALLGRELSVEAGELTPTLKVRRDVVLSRYGHLLEELYR